MRKFPRPALALLLSLPLICGVAFYAAYHSLTKELDEKFFSSVDSVPTRVFSRPWFVQASQPLSLKELKARMAEREYKEISPNQAPVGGTFSVANADAGVAVKIFLKDANYPLEYARYLSEWKGAIFLGPGLVSLVLEGGRVKEIWSEVQERQQINTLVVEPVLVAQLSGQNREARKSVTLGEIPHTLLKAIVTVEDQRFLEHSGIDPRGIARSIWANLRAGSYVQGASTITQQLIRNIYLTPAKTISRKVKEMAMAILLETRYSKDVILEKYLNEVYFGQTGNLEIRGVSQAAKYYFDKSVTELTIAEQATLAAFIRGPFFYSPYKYLDRAKQRQEMVLKKMVENAIISEREYRDALKFKLVFAPPAKTLDRAPYFTDMLKSQLIKELPEQTVAGAGYKIYSTLDTYYQKHAEENVSKGLEQLENNIRKGLAKKKNDPEQRLLQGAMVAVDPATGQILSMVGGRSFAESNYNRVLLMRRQIGSIFKPFVYLAALIYGKDAEGQPYNSISKLKDEPFTYSYDDQKWSPKNYEGEYLGTVTLRHALANSLNIPTAKLAISVGLPYVVTVAERAGIDIPIAPLPSISLGVTELTPLEVARAYTTIASSGVKKDLTAILMMLDENDDLVAHYVLREEQSLPLPETAYLVDLLQSVFSIGTAKIAKSWGFLTPAAGKTGTTNEFRDAWFAGFTSRILAVSWVGYDRDDEDVKKIRKGFKLTGAVAALPIWAQFMADTHDSGASDELPVPTGTLRRLKVDLLSGGLATDACSHGNNIVEETFTYNSTPRYSCPTR